jgi:Aminotransferase class I and II
MNLPPQPEEAKLRERIAEGLAAVQRRPDLLSLLSYRQSAGSEEDRAAAAEWLRPRLGDVSVDRILVCAGAPAAMTALLTAFAQAGDIILTEPLTYPGFRALAAHCGVQPYPLPTDGEGILPEALGEACDSDQGEGSLLHTDNPKPHHSNHVESASTGSCGDCAPIWPTHFRGRHLWSAAAAGTGSTCGDPSRTHLLHRQPGEMSAARVAHRLLCRTRFGKRRPSRRGNPRNLSDGAAFDEQPRKPWICDGSSEEILRATRQEATIRQRLARDLLSNLEFAAHPEGHHIWLTLPSDWHRAEFVGYVRPRGLAAVASEAFAISTDRPNAVRISLGAAGDADQLRQALKLVTDTLAQSPLMSAFPSSRRVNLWLSFKRLFQALPGKAGGTAVMTTVDHPLMRGLEPHDR